MNTNQLTQTGLKNVSFICIWIILFIHFVSSLPSLFSGEKKIRRWWWWLLLLTCTNYLFSGASSGFRYSCYKNKTLYWWCMKHLLLLGILRSSISSCTVIKKVSSLSFCWLAFLKAKYNLSWYSYLRGTSGH